MASSDKTGLGLFSDPVGWSRSAVGSTFWFSVIAGFHILMGIMLVVFGGERMVAAVIPFAALPIAYLYALKRLLQELDQKDSENRELRRGLRELKTQVWETEQRKENVRKEER